MDVLREATFGRGKVQLCLGDLAAIPEPDACDVLVVSAFRDDYLPTPGTLIRSLQERGVVVADLAAHKAADLRTTSSCWLSHPIPSAATVGFSRILCYEPLSPSGAERTVGDVFRALVPFVGADTQMIRSVSMPLLAAGNMGQPPGRMLRAILLAASEWMSHGLPLDLLRVVVRADGTIDDLVEVFDTTYQHSAEKARTFGHEPQPETHEVFISYARSDGKDVVEAIRRHVADQAPHIDLLIDSVSLDVGVFWQAEIADMIERSNQVIAVLTQGFWDSPHCLEEYSMAKLLHTERGGGVLVPLYARTCRLPLYARSINYIDCREADPQRIAAACGQALRPTG